jgi:hypothetical protein
VTKRSFIVCLPSVFFLFGARFLLAVGVNNSDSFPLISYTIRRSVYITIHLQQRKECWSLKFQCGEQGISFYLCPVSHLSLRSEVNESPDQAANYHILELSVGGFISESIWVVAEVARG